MLRVLQICPHAIVSLLSEWDRYHPNCRPECLADGDRPIRGRLVDYEYFVRPLYRMLQDLCDPRFFIVCRDDAGNGRFHGGAQVVCTDACGDRTKSGWRRNQQRRRSWTACLICPHLTSRHAVINRTMRRNGHPPPSRSGQLTDGCHTAVPVRSSRTNFTSTRMHRVTTRLMDRLANTRQVIPGPHEASAMATKPL